MLGHTPITKLPRLLEVAKDGQKTGLLQVGTGTGSSLITSLSGQQLAVFQQSSSHEQSEQNSRGQFVSPEMNLHLNFIYGAT